MIDLVRAAIEGEQRSLGRLLSVVESDAVAAARALAEAGNVAGAAQVVGVTGPPGAGKSTLVCRLAEALLAEGERVAVLACDPTSPFSGGALLGDRVRMTSVRIGDGGAFVRSVATRGHGGGLAGATADLADVLIAAGFDRVLVETVGTGQTEIDVAGIADTVIVVSVPGLGDAVQAGKAGILEVAHVHAVNKADRAGANRLAGQIQSMAGASVRDGWRPPVLLVSARTGTGLDALLDALGAHRRHLLASGASSRAREARVRGRILSLAEQAYARSVRSDAGRSLLARQCERVAAGEIDAETAARELVGSLTGERAADPAGTPGKAQRDETLTRSRGPR